MPQTKKVKTNNIEKQNEPIGTEHIVGMIRSIISCCIQIGCNSISIEYIKRFYKGKNFDECFAKTLPYLTTRSISGMEDSKTYSFDLERMFFDGTIVCNFSLRDAVKKSDFL